METKEPTLVFDQERASNIMTTAQILFAGGSGVVGRTAVRWFRDRHPNIPILVGGRNLQFSSEVAQEVGAAEAVAIDLDKPRLGLDDDIAVAAVVTLSAVLGLNDRSPARPGLYLPELLSDAKWFLDELRSVGATICEDSK